jgi:ribosomal protein S16
VNIERIRYWISVGAQPSDRVGWLLGKLGVIPAPPVKLAVETAIPKFLRDKKTVADAGKKSVSAESKK